MLIPEQLQEDWYDNKALFEMLQNLGKEMSEFRQGLGKEISELRVELRETTTKIRDYNGLRDDVKDYKEEVQSLKAMTESKNEICKDIKIDIYNIVMTIIAAAAVLVAVFK